MTTDLRVCFMGDSYTAGVGDPQHLGWVGRVAARTDAAGRALTAYVLGVRGQTSQQVAARFGAETAARLPPGFDVRVVLAVGVNDTTLLDGSPRVCTGDSARHLQQMLRQAQEAGWPALVIGPPPIADAAQNERIAQLDTGFARVCAAARAPYVTVFDPLLGDPVWMREITAGTALTPALPDTSAWQT